MSQILYSQPVSVCSNAPGLSAAGVHAPAGAPPCCTVRAPAGAPPCCTVRAPAAAPPCCTVYAPAGAPPCCTVRAPGPNEQRYPRLTPPPPPPPPLNILSIIPAVEAGKIGRLDVPARCVRTRVAHATLPQLRFSTSIPKKPTGCVSTHETQSEI